MRKINQTPLWRQTPPAIFPVSLGFMGLGLAWRNASSVVPVPHEIGDLLLGLSTAFLIYFLGIYAAKVARRPAALWEDMKTPQGRAGVAALPMAVMLLSAALLPFNVSVPQVWWTGVVLQMATITLSILTLWQGAPELRAFSPFQYLSFVGPAVAPIAGVPMGFIGASYWLTMFTLVAWFVISAGYSRRLMDKRPPLQFRPSLAISLAASSLLGIAFSLLHMLAMFYLFYAIAWGLAVVLLLSGRWLMAGGWTPFWGAFTFPIATFTNLQILALHQGVGVIALIGLWAGLVIGTPLILYIVYRAGMAFLQGEFSAKSGAAVA